MKRLVLLLLIGLGWVAYNRLAKPGMAERGGDPYPFPTAESHASIAVDDPAELASWTRELGCSEDDLRTAIGTVGRSVEAVRDYLARR